MVMTPNYDLDIDTTLGGDNASDYVVASQKAIKAYVDNNSSGGSVSTDGITINTNADDEIQAIGVIEKNTGAVKYDWVGTLAEYTAQNVATLHPTWLCFITDDETSSNFANVDASNFTSIGKSALSGFAMPSGNYVDLTPVHQTTYIAPANGYYTIRSSSDTLITLVSGGVDVMATWGEGYSATFLPVYKGATIRLEFAGTPSFFRFVYAQGEI